MDDDNSKLMEAYTVVFDGLVHLGPGSPSITRNVVDGLRPLLPSSPRVADFGCGVGASALVLAERLPTARVLAVDYHVPFIARLQAEAAARGLGERMCAVVGDMASPPPLDGASGALDLIWSESAIYSLGRAKAFALWRPLLQTGGWLVFSDIVWHRTPEERSSEAFTFWMNEYPDIAATDTVMGELTAAGFHPRDPVPAEQGAWANYYEPLRDRLRVLAKRPDRPPALINVMAAMEREIAMYDHAGDEVALVFFIAQRDSSVE